MLFSSIYSIGLSQGPGLQTYLPNVFPVNPNAFEFIKYTEVPVSKYTGVSNINIPIYTIKANGLDIPIGLTYHSNGFRVSEEAGWTGLGWTLNAGGSIVQVVNGFDDFGWYRNRNNELSSMVNDPNSKISQSILNTCTNVNFTVQTEGSCLPVPQNSSILNFTESSSMLNGTKDMEPDIFKFNMLGYSGEFILDWQNDVFKCISDNNIRVEPANYINVSGSTDVHVNHFKIITPDGNQFIFELKEETIIGRNIRLANTTYSQLEHIEGQKSSRVYQLTSIITNGGDIVTFDYVQTSLIENLPIVSKFSELYSFKRMIGGEGIYLPPTPIQNIFPNIECTTVGFSKQSFSYLSSISFPSGIITFNSSNDRIDCIGARKLNSITVKDDRSVPLKSLDFTYDYFIGHSSGTNTDDYVNNSNYYVTNKQASELTHRLRLVSVKESDKPAYQFEYDQEALPKKTSLAADYWGYYNGKLNNSDQFPNLNMLGVSGVNLAGINNNKNSNLSSTKAAVLKKITYPTGGTSEFEYELNSFDNYKVPDDQHSTITSVFLNDRNNFDDHPAEAFSVDIPSILYGGEFNISTYGPNSGSTNASSAYIRLSILKKTASNKNLVYNTPFTFWPTYFTAPVGQLSNFVNDVVTDIKWLSFEFNSSAQQYETFKLLQDQILKLDPQYIYIIQAYLDNSFGPQTNSSLDANASVHFTLLKNESHDISYGAGLRIKTIKTQDRISPPLVKTYNYIGGKLVTPLTHISKTAFEYHYGECAIGSGDGCYMGIDHQIVTKTTVNTSNFYAPSTSASGQYVGYDKVEESNAVEELGTLLPDANGKVVDSFTNTPDIGIIDPTLLQDEIAVTSFNFVYPARKAIIQNGLVLQSSVFDKSQQLIEQTINNYFPTSITCVYGRVIGYSGQLFEMTGGGPCIRQLYSIGFYPISSNKTLLSSNTKTIYSRSNPLTTLQNNYFDGHDQISRTVQADSKHGTISTYFKYPYDFSEYFFSMTSNNVITPVIEKRIERNTTTIFNSRDIYQSMGGSTTPLVYVKQKTLSAIGSSNLEDDIIYDVYGDINSADRYKLLQYHTRSGVVTSIFWGYNGQYPIAKVVGIDYSTAKTYISQSILDVAGNLNDADLRTELNKLRNIANTLVTTYTYKPLIGISSETDPNNRTMFYEYNGAGRLSLIRDQDQNILKKFCYNYQGQPETCPLGIGNAQKSGTFTKQCGSGYTGTQVTYTVAANTYFAATQSEADALAQADVDTKGQGNANSNPDATCTPIAPTVFYSQPINSNYFSQNCTTGQSPVAYPVSIPYGAFTSTVSPEPANQLAQQAAQNQANQNGICISQTIYARIEVENYSDDAHDNTYSDGSREVAHAKSGDIWVRFYSDAACTQPFTFTSPLTVNWTLNGIWESSTDYNPYSYPIALSALAGENGALLNYFNSLGGEYYWYNSDGDLVDYEYYRDYYSLAVNGTLYVIVPPNQVPDNW